MHFTKINSFKTTETAFVLGQYALENRKPSDPRLLFYVNCAPRRDRRDSRHNNEGEGLVYCKLDNGVEIIAVHSGYSLSVIRNNIVSLRHVHVDKGGSQFRSRDNFPPFVAAVAQGLDLNPWLGEELKPADLIPEFKEGYIGYIDSFGNFKTTFRASSQHLKELKAGDEVEISINGTEVVARVATGSFSVPEGNLALSLGSSGWDDRFWEVFQRGGSAYHTFKKPQVGAEVKIIKL
jgi:S-adenosylmethionine hydrolase